MENSEPKKKSLEELSKEELLLVLDKLKIKTLQLSQSNTELKQQCENLQNEKEEIRKKAQQVVLHCKELERTNAELSSKGSATSSDTDAPKADDSNEKLSQAQKEVLKYKEGFEQLAQKFRTLKTAYETKHAELEAANNEISKMKLQVNVSSSAPLYSGENSLHESQDQTTTSHTHTVQAQEVRSLSKVYTKQILTIPNCNIIGIRHSNSGTKSHHRFITKLQ